MQVEGTGPAAADPRHGEIMAAADGVAQLAGDDPRPGQAEGALLRRRGRDQQVEAILLEAIEVEMPRNDPGAPGGGAERGHLLLRPGDRQPVIQPVGVREPQRRTAPGVVASRLGRGALDLSRVRAIARLRGVLRRGDRHGTGPFVRTCVSLCLQISRGAHPRRQARERRPMPREPQGRADLAANQPASIGSAAIRAGHRPPRRPWPRPSASASRAGLPVTTRGPPRQDKADRIGAEAAMLDIAPAIDLAEHRPEPGVRRAQPVPQRLHRTGTRVGTASDGDLAHGVTAKGELDGGRGEAQPLDVETDQRETPEPGGHQQQQGAIAQPGEIPGASDRHAHQLGGSRRRGATRASVAAAGIPENGFHQRIGDRRSETAPAVLVGDGGGAAAQRAGAQPCRGGAEKATPRSPGRRAARPRPPPRTRSRRRSSRLCRAALSRRPAGVGPRLRADHPAWPMKGPRSAVPTCMPLPASPARRHPAGFAAAAGKAERFRGLLDLGKPD